MSGELAGGGNPISLMTLPIHGWDPDQTLGGRPVSIPLRGRLISGNFYIDPVNYPGIENEYPSITGWFP